VLVLERENTSTILEPLAACNYYDINKLTMTPTKSRGLILLRTFMAGGTTVVAAASGARCLERTVRFGITLNEFTEAEQEMHLAPIDKASLSGSEKIMWAAHELGYKWNQCPGYQSCEMQEMRYLLGCKYGASGRPSYLDDALDMAPRLCTHEG
jgi:hypothetical protein